MAAAGRLANAEYSQVLAVFIALAGYYSDNSALLISLFAPGVARVLEVTNSQFAVILCVHRLADKARQGAAPQRERGFRDTS